MKLQEQDVFNKRFAHSISTMIESRLIWYKHYYCWADEIILSMDEPPLWVLEIATIKYFPNAVTAVNSFVYSEPFENFSGQDEEEYVACLFLRYGRGEISWATFLNEAALFTDARNGDRDCSYFYVKLSTLEDTEYSKVIEQSQRAEVESEYTDAIDTMKNLYIGFLEYFRKYVADEARQPQQ